MPTTVTATLAPQGVQVTVTTTAAGAATLDVSRIQRSNTALVRGGDGADISGGAWASTDYELLYQAPAVYAARVYDTAGVQLEQASSSAVTVPEGRVWLRNVWDSSLAMPVQLVGKVSGDNSSESRSALLRPLGRSNPVAVTDVRSGSSGESTVLTRTDVEERALRGLFATGDILMFTAPASFDVGWPMYIVVGAVTYRRVSGALDDARLISFAWTQVDRPSDGAVPSPTVWGTYVSQGTIWDDWISAGTPWSDVAYPPTTTTKTPVGWE